MEFHLVAGRNSQQEREREAFKYCHNAKFLALSELNVCEHKAILSYVGEKSYPFDAEWMYFIMEF